MNQTCRQLPTKKKSCLTSIHTFLFQPLNKTSYYQSTIAIDYSPLMDEQGKQCNIIPTFNHDNNIRTPAFLTDLDKNNIELFPLIPKQPSKIIQDSKTLDGAQIYQPRPTNSFCFVCKESYFDYIKHIDHKIHKKNLATNPYTAQINQLAEHYKQTKFDIKIMKKFSSNSSLDQQNCKQSKSKKKRIYLSPIFQCGDCKSTHSHISSNGDGSSFGKYSHFSLH